MSYLSAYRHDAFVSYAHGPRTALFRGEDDDLLGQWSRHLVRDLTTLIAVKLGTKDEARRVSLWMDAALAGNEPLNDALKEHVEQSALLLVIMSPYYLQSQWCGREIEWFTAMQAGKRAKHRVFVARAWWTDAARWPAHLKSQDGVGYCFLPQDDEHADPFGYPCSKDRDPAYWSVVMRLATDMAKEIKSIELERQENLRPGNSGRPQAPDRSVFLGFATDSLQDDRQELRERLTASGFRVVPPVEEDPVDETSLRTALETYLRSSGGLVLMANEYPGLWPRGDDGGVVSFQMQVAKQYNIPSYLWLRVADLGRVRKAEYRTYLERVVARAISDGTTLQHDSIDAFAIYVQERVQSSAACDGSVEEVAVICSNLSADSAVCVDFREATLQAVHETKREMFIFDFAGNGEQVKLAKLGERIREADTVLVLCFDQAWDWARGLIREISSLSDPRDGQRAKLLVAVPRDQNQGLYDASVFGFRTVNGLTVGADRLRAMVAQEIRSARRVHHDGNGAAGG